MWTHIRHFLCEQSGLGLHCLSKRLLKQTTFVAIGPFKVNDAKLLSTVLKYDREFRNSHDCIW